MIKLLSLLKQVHIHPLLWIVVALSVATAHFLELSLLLMIIFIHEMGHAAAASFFSWRVKKISLLPFGGVAEMDEHGNRPLKEEALVILAGPLQHIWLIGGAYLLKELSILSPELFTTFLQFNLMILLFNLLPIWPLDGGKLLFLWLSLKQSFPIAHKRTIYISFSGIILFVLFVLFTEPLNLNVWIILSFLAFSLFYEWRQSRYVFVRFLLERHYGKTDYFRSLRPIVVAKDDLIIDVLERFQRGYKHPIIVAENGEKTASLDENELLHAYFSEKQLTAKIGDLLYYY